MHGLIIKQATASEGSKNTFNGPTFRRHSLKLKKKKNFDL